MALPSCSPFVHAPTTALSRAVATTYRSHLGHPTRRSRAFYPAPVPPVAPLTCLPPDTPQEAFDMGGIAVSLASLRLKNRAHRSKEQRAAGKWDRVDPIELEKVTLPRV